VNSRPPKAYTASFCEALTYAADLHSRQLRKGTTIPYVSHLLAVCAYVWEDGGSEEEAIAALLHDAVEDQGGLETLDEIRKRFGDRVGDIVLACSDTTEKPKPPWRQRKERYVDSLEHAETSVLRVAAADKLHNAQATLQDLRAEGPAVWDRFNAGPHDFIWYHREVLRVLEERLPGSRSVALLRQVLDQLEADR
jgi:(p)ppGpp synthase/HD superfamily hydrolase